MPEPPAVATDHERIADELLRQTQANDGLAPVDLERFWADDATARQDPFAADCPQLPQGLSGGMHECVFAELGIEEDWHRWNHDPHWRQELNLAYNDRAERIVGRRLLNEQPPGDPEKRYQGVKQLHDVFEAERVWHHESYWITPAANTEGELEALLDRVERRLENLRDFLLPDDWDQQKARLMPQGIAPPRYRAQRGPVTFATSVLGTENLIFLIMDRPDLARRFSDLIRRAMLGIAQTLDDEHDEPADAAPHGFSFMDDNCALMTPDMYELFGYPVLEAVFNRYSPDPGDRRYQHSDSAMAHLLPLLGRLKLNHVNFGPTVSIREIREHLPDAVISGVLAPFTFSRDEQRNIVLELLRDFEQARDHGRGVVFTTAGSINNGSRLTGLRLVMSAIQQHARYA